MCGWRFVITLMFTLHSAHLIPKFNIRDLIDVMELVSSILTTTSFENQSCSEHNKACAQPSRKRGIHALVFEVTNQMDASSCSTRVTKENATAVLVTEPKKSRGDYRKGVEARMAKKSTPTTKLSA